MDNQLKSLKRIFSLNHNEKLSLLKAIKSEVKIAQKPQPSIHGHPAFRSKETQEVFLCPHMHCEFYQVLPSEYLTYYDENGNQYTPTEEQKKIMDAQGILPDGYKADKLDYGFVANGRFFDAGNIQEAVDQIVQEELAKRKQVNPND